MDADEFWQQRLAQIPDRRERELQAKRDAAAMDICGIDIYELYALQEEAIREQTNEDQG